MIVAASFKSSLYSFAVSGPISMIRSSFVTLRIVFIVPFASSENALPQTTSIGSGMDFTFSVAFFISFAATSTSSFSTSDFPIL